MEEVMNILREIRDDVDFEKEKNLVSDGIFESFEILMCISSFEDEFGIEFPGDAIEPENFESAEAMWDVICKLKG